MVTDITKVGDGLGLRTLFISYIIKTEKEGRSPPSSRHLMDLILIGFHNDACFFHSLSRKAPVVCP